MHTYEVYSTKAERIEILKAFTSNNPFWQQQNDPANYVSYEANVSMDVDPHLPLRCEQRFVSSDAFFLAIETFFNSEGVDQDTGEELPSVADLLPGDKVVLIDKRNKVSFVFHYFGIDSGTGRDEILCKTVYDFRSFSKTRFYKGDKVYELKTLDNGEIVTSYIDDSLLTFI
ncbi:hypothetical protein MZM54_04970 [[Brevibacterium] frigoritolerans]|nr:hypothetical protein [Peribacillus frigoritolerans]